MTFSQLALAFFVDLPFCWISWRFFLRPKLERFVRERAREELTVARRLQIATVNTGARHALFG
jgi:hypothetical protein